MTEHLEALTKGPSMDFWGNDHVKCPHCGDKHEPYALEWFYLYEEDSHDVKCPSCDRDFVVSTRVSYTFSTDEQDA